MLAVHWSATAVFVSLDKKGRVMKIQLKVFSAMPGISISKGEGTRPKKRTFKSDSVSIIKRAMQTFAVHENCAVSRMNLPAVRFL